MVTITLYAKQKKRHRCTEHFWTLWEKARVGCSERIALKHVYYQGWNRSLAQAGCMRQVLRAGALGWPRGMGWGGRREVGSGWGAHVNPWLIYVNIWQKPLQYCKVISLQLIKINEKKFSIIKQRNNLKEEGIKPMRGNIKQVKKKVYDCLHNLWLSRTKEEDAVLWVCAERPNLVRDVIQRMRIWSSISQWGIDEEEKSFLEQGIVSSNQFAKASTQWMTYWNNFCL